MAQLITTIINTIHLAEITNKYNA